MVDTRKPQPTRKAELLKSENSAMNSFIESKAAAHQNELDKHPLTGDGVKVPETIKSQWSKK